MKCQLARVYSQSRKDAPTKVHWFPEDTYYSPASTVSLCQQVTHALSDLEIGIYCEKFVSVDWNRMCQPCSVAKIRLELLEELGE